MVILALLLNLVLVGFGRLAAPRDIQVINRLIEPTGGRIVVGGENVREIDGDELRRRIGYIIQAATLFPTSPSRRTSRSLSQGAPRRPADPTKVPGTVPTRELMISGGADMMREYTGPAWTTYLGQRKGIADERGQCLAVKEADVVNGLSWLRPAPLDNTCALASPSSRSSTRASCGLTHTLTLTLTLTAYGLTRGRARAA